MMANQGLSAAVTKVNHALNMTGWGLVTQANTKAKVVVDPVGATQFKNIQLYSWVTTTEYE